MSGDPTKASLWADADVYIGDDLTAAVPATATTAFGVTWKLTGLLDGEGGFAQTREEAKEDHYAWGGILVRTSRRNFKLAVKFWVLEDNVTTRRLVWPGSPAGSLIVPRPVPIKMAFETKEGAKVHRLITARHAEVDVTADIVDNESSLTKYELTATIFPTSAGVLFTEQSAAAA